MISIFISFRIYFLKCMKKRMRVFLSGLKSGNKNTQHLISIFCLSHIQGIRHLI